MIIVMTNEIDQNYITELEEKNRKMRRILNKLEEIGEKRLSLINKDGRYVVQDSKGELASDSDIIKVIQIL